MSIVNIVIAFATSVNTRDGFGARVVDWPLAAESKVKQLSVDQKHRILNGDMETETIADELDIE